MWDWLHAHKEEFQAIGPMLGALAALGALYVGWLKAREVELRKEDVLKWANEAISEMQSLVVVCRHWRSLDAHDAKARLTDIMVRTSILVEQGRLLFKNQVTDQHGAWQETAYRGYRPKILDFIVVCHEIAGSWIGAGESERAAMLKIAESYKRKFVSLAQKEVGRGRTASVETGKGGEGLRLEDLLKEAGEL